MKITIRKKKYTINMLKFIRFIGITFVIIMLIIWIIFQLTTLFTKVLFNNTERNILDNTPNINSIIETQAYASECAVDDTVQMGCIDYSKKPEGLDDIYYEHVINIAKHEDVPMEILLAVITTENRLYDANAYYKNVNGTVDAGLCQINSAYLDYFAEKYNIENLDPYNVEQSITFVARHMKYLSNYAIDNYRLSEMDSYIFAAGAYNRGLSNECKYRNMYSYKIEFLANYEKFI